ncbi:MAG: HTTM domain-containing protein [Flavobacteriales bacterium]|nr:HTTM domain-containing protein [Flavobacteriales bacterium]
MNSIQHLFMLDFSWGINKVSPALNQTGFSSQLINMLDHGGEGLAITLIGVQLVCLGGAIFFKPKRILTFIGYLASASLINSTYMLNSGGHHLILLILFFLIFINENDRSENTWKNAINHGGLMAIKIQVCFVYFISALYKIIGESWLDGSAIWQSLMSNEYTLPVFQDYFPENNWFFTSITYLLIAFQLLFPILIWFKKTRRWMILIGLLIHFFIAFGLGLFNFGLAMMIGYFAFYEESMFRWWKMFRRKIEL